MNEYLPKIINILLRGLTLACKFALVFVLAKFLEPAEVGMYGLLAATIGYCIYIVGLDFYTYSTRKIITSEIHDSGRIIKNHSAVTLIAYIAITPALIALFKNEILPIQYITWFFVILVLEHISQEAHRILIAISQPLMASTVLFIRSGLWVIAVIAVMQLHTEARNIEYVFFAWATGGMLAIALTIYSLKKKKLGGWHESIQWDWIIKGCKIAAPFLISTIAIRGIYTIDKYWIEYLTDLETLAAYVIFMGMSNALVSFADSGIFAFSYPKLVLQWKEGAPAEYKSTLKIMLSHLIILIIMFCSISLILIDPILEWIDRDIYKNHVSIFYWLLGSSAVISVSMIPHFALYAQGKDRHIIISQIIGLATFITSAVLISKINSVNAIPAAVFCGFSAILIWKTIAYYILTPKEYLLFNA